MKLKAEEVHQMKIDAFIDWPELKRIIVDAVLTELAKQWPSPIVPCPPLKIEIEQCTEGSPAYSVRKWRARVSGVQTLENSNEA